MFVAAAKFAFNGRAIIKKIKQQKKYEFKYEFTVFTCVFFLKNYATQHTQKQKIKTNTPLSLIKKNLI